MAFRYKAVILLLSVMGVISNPVEHSERMMLRKRMDQNKASSYVYRSDNNGPLQIYYLTADDLNRKYHHPTAPIYQQKSAAYKYSDPPIASAYPISFYPPKPNHSQTVGKLDLPLTKSQTLAKIELPIPTIYGQSGHELPIPKLYGQIKNSHELPIPKLYGQIHNKHELPIPKTYNQNINKLESPTPKAPKTYSQILKLEIPAPVIHEPSSDMSDESKSSSSSSSSSDESDYGDHDSSMADHSSHSKDYSNEGGNSHEEKYLKKNGGNSKNGYNNEYKFKKGKKGSYDTKFEADDEEEEGGKKSSHHDEADAHSEHHEGGKNEKGGDFGKKKHHEKGSKSKGYHNVFMKDEYKKDHTFYGKKKFIEL